MSDTTPTPEPTDVEALLAREAYRALYPGSVNLPDSQRSPEADRIEADRAYQTWDEGRAGYAPIQICQRLAAVQAAALVPWVAQQRADALREAAEEWRTEEPQRSTHAHVRFFARELDLRADRIAPTTEETQP